MFSFLISYTRIFGLLPFLVAGVTVTMFYFLIILPFFMTFNISHKYQVVYFYQISSLHSNEKLKVSKCDNGKKFVNSTFKKFCDSNVIHFLFSYPYNTPQNGKVERKIQSINNILCTLLNHASIPFSFWSHALQMTTYSSIFFLLNPKISLSYSQSLS